jgi:uncharacterized protein
MTRTLTHSGRMVDLVDPSPSDIDFGDIATSLAKQCRFNGHTTAFYSVAQHSVLVADQATRLAKPYALLHDAHEAYIGDITLPVRQCFPLAQMQMLSRAIDVAIHDAAGLAWPPPDFIAAEVKHLDKVLLMTERRDLMARSSVSWGDLEKIPPLPTVIKPLGWVIAEGMFRNRLADLFPNL